MSTSLFERLANEHPQVVMKLTNQYRMNDDINTVSNTLIYGGDLSCGSAEVAARRLEFPPPGAHALPPPRQQPDWLRVAVKPAAGVVVLSTDNMKEQSLERKSKAARGYENATEAALTAVLVQGLIKCGVQSEDIGIISPYRAQLRLLRQNIQRHAPDVEVLARPTSACLLCPV